MHSMVLKRTTLLVTLAAVLAAAFSAATAHAGGDAPALNPSIVSVPILRTDTALGNAADAIDSGNGAAAVGPLRASRRGLIRSYTGAKFLIAHMPPPDAEEARLGSRTFVRLAKRFIRRSPRGPSRLVHRRAGDDRPGAE